MKRSEAVRILTDKINEDQYIDYQVWDYQVSAALELLEKAGMKPPADEKLHDCMCINCESARDTAWEPEDV